MRRFLMGIALLLMVVSVYAAQRTVEEDKYVQLEFNKVAEQKWSSNDYFKICLADHSNHDYPYMEIKFDPLHSGKWSIAGYYELGVGHNCIEGWPSYEKGPNYTVRSTSGWLNIACVSSRTYKIDAEFSADNGVNYKFSYTAALNEITGKDGAVVIDRIGDGFLPEVTFVSIGQVIESRLARSGVLEMPKTNFPIHNGLTFIGWTTEQHIDCHNAPTLAQNGDNVTDNTTYYAVYAHPDGSKTPFEEVASILFVGAAQIDSAWYFDRYGVARTGYTNIMLDMVGAYENIRGIRGAWVRPGTYGVKIGAHESDNEYKVTTNHDRNQNQQGYITLDMEHGATISKVVVTSEKATPHDKGKMLVEIDGVAIPGPKPYGNFVEYIPANPISSNSVTLATESEAAYVKSVEIYTGGIGYDYYTNYYDDAITSIPTMTGSNDTDAVKAIRNGQVVIIRGNEMFDIYGQKVR